MRAILALAALGATIAAWGSAHFRAGIVEDDAALEARRAAVREGFRKDPVWPEDEERTVDLLVGTRLESIGYRLRRSSPKLASALERRLLARPDDATARLVLIGYYSPFGSERDRRDHDRHARWVLEHYPGGEFSMIPGALIQPGTAGAAAALAFWREQARLHPTDPEILGNAAEYSDSQDRAFSARLFERAIALEPRRCRWRYEAGLFYSRWAGRERPPRAAALFRLAAAHLRVALALLDEKGVAASPYYRADIAEPARLAARAGRS